MYGSLSAQVYLLDSVGSCSWVEDEGCKDFVTNLRTAFPDADLVSLPFSYGKIN